MGEVIEAPLANSKATHSMQPLRMGPHTAGAAIACFCDHGIRGTVSDKGKLFISSCDRAILSQGTRWKLLSTP
jgi:hypothetical protein